MNQPIHVLFVCGRNQWRSPTAARIYADDPRVCVRSAGLSPQSRRQIKARDLEWADLVLVMERRHRDLFRGHALPTVASLDIPDEYPFMDPELVDRLRAAIEPYLEDSGQPG